MTLPRGYTLLPEYSCWRSIRDRCTNPNHRAFKYYGGRGISFSPRWQSFENFLADVGPKPGKEYSIDRFPNNDGNYEPGNVRWATRDQQQANTRKTRFVIFRGERVAYCTAYQALGISKNSALARLRLGWSAQRAIDTPFRKLRYLTDAQRAEIKAITGMSQDRIAEKFGTSQSVVSEIRLGKKRTKK